MSVATSSAALLPLTHWSSTISSDKTRTWGDIGKFFIAWVLLECEAVFLKYGINNNRRELLLRTSDRTDREKASSIEHLRHYNDNWYRFLIQKLVTGCPDAQSLLNNKVTFITLNYDVSLEFQLSQGLSAIAQDRKS